MSHDLVVAAQQDLCDVRRYLDVLTRWLHRVPAARQTFVSLFSCKGVVRDQVARDLYNSAAFTGFNVTHPFDRYIFTSMHPDHLRRMQDRYEAQYRSLSPNVLFLAGDSNDLAQGIVGENLFYQDIVQDPAPTIVFVNPNDLRMQWRTLEALAQLPHLYLVLFYPLDALNRYIPRTIHSNFTTEVDLFFGTHQWRDLYAKALGHNKQRMLLSYYMQRMRALGFRDVMSNNQYALSPSDKADDMSLYCLLFAHKQMLPSRFWEEAMADSFLPPRTETAPLRQRISSIPFQK